MSITVNELKNPYFHMWVFVCILQSLVASWAYLRCFKIKVPKAVVYFFVVFSYTFLPVGIKLLINGNTINVISPIFGIIFPIVLLSLVTYGSKIKIGIFSILNLLLDSIVETILHITMNNIGMYTSVTELNYERVMVSILFLFIITPIKYIMAVIWSKAVNKAVIRISWMFIVFPIAQALAYSAMMLQNLYWNEHSFSSFYFILAAMIIFAISDILFLYFISDFEKKKHLEQELKTIEYTRMLEEKHYETIEAKRYETAKIRHDIKNQIIVMRNLIMSGKLNDAEELIDSLEKNIDNTKEYEYCSVPIVNAIISEKSTICEMNDIDFTADICLEQIDGISKNHLCCIFSNLIDNAIKETEKIELLTDRRIEIKAAQKHSYTLIRCENTVPKDTVNQKLDPQKSSGYGLKILRDIALEYNGSFDIEIKDGICTAVVAVTSENAVIDERKEK